MRRCIALVLCIALCFGLFAVPASAASTLSDKLYTVATDIFTWLDSPLFGGSSFHGGGRASSPFGGGGRYTDYVSGLDTTYNSHVVGPNGYNLTLNAIYSEAPEFTGGLSWSIKCKEKNWMYVQFNNMVAPVNGYYKWFSDLNLVNCSYQLNGKFGTSGSDASIIGFSSEYYLTAGQHLYERNYYLPFNLTDYHSYAIASGSCGWFCRPTSWTTDPVYGQTINNANNRMSSIIPYIQSWNITNQTNNYYYGSVSDGNVTSIYDTNIFNETTNVFTLPGDTPTTYNITDWYYDYSTRTYNCTDGTNNYVVTYGDDHITVTVPDGSGGTTSTDYYYVHQTPVPTPAVPGSDTAFPDSSSDNYEDDPNTTGGFFSTVWKAFKDGLASLIAGIINGLFKGIKALIDGITSVFSGLVSGFFGFVTSFFGSFGTGPGQVGQFFGGGVVDLD